MSTNRLFRPFRRISASGAYFPEVDGLRFLSILIVVLCHTFIAWSRQYHFGEGVLPRSLHYLQYGGYNGVLLFFAISGYIVALPFAKALPAGRSLNLKNYYLRRLVRIEPPYFIIMSGFFLLYVLSGHARYYAPHYAASAIYLHNLVFPHVPGLNDVAWSLEVEVQFYLIAPLIFRLFRLHRRTRLLLLAALALLSSALPLWCPLPFISLYQYLGFFLGGILMADIVVQGIKLRNGQQYLLAGTGIFSLLFLFFGFFGLPALHDWLAPLCVFLILLAALTDTPLRRWIGAGVVPVIGGMCYSIYLIHNLMLVFLFRYGVALLPGKASLVAFAANAVLMLLLVLLAGAVVFVLVERPFMKFSSWYPLFERPGNEQE